MRWFQFGAFSLLFRLHGHRLPHTDDFLGGPNEVWSFGEEAYEIIKRYMLLRERLRPYIMDQMRPLFLDFPNDSSCYSIEDEYMFGPDLLVAPILEAGARPGRCTYLPISFGKMPGPDCNTKVDIGSMCLLHLRQLFLNADSQLLDVFSTNPEGRNAWRSAYEIRVAALEHEKRRFYMYQEFSLAKPQRINHREPG